MQHDYDEYYDTKVSRPYGNSKAGCLFGITLFLLGLAMIGITVADLVTANYNQMSTSSFAYTYVWDENPFWPSYGKGFWVGLIVCAAGFLGIASSLEHTITSVYVFIAMCVSSSILSFYLLITACIPVGKFVDYGPAGVLVNYYYNSLAFNAALIGLGGLGFLGAGFAAAISAILVGCCTERRGYGGPFVEQYYRAHPSHAHAYAQLTHAQPFHMPKKAFFSPRLQINQP